MTTNKKRSILDNFEARFKKSTLSLMVLKILSEREIYAYEITSEAFKRSKADIRCPYHIRH